MDHKGNGGLLRTFVAQKSLLFEGASLLLLLLEKRGFVSGKVRLAHKSSSNFFTNAKRARAGDFFLFALGLTTGTGNEKRRTLSLRKGVITEQKKIFRFLLIKSVHEKSKELANLFSSFFRPLQSSTFTRDSRPYNCRCCSSANFILGNKSNQC